MSVKKRKKSLVGWVNLAWFDFFGWSRWMDKFTKQKVKCLRVPYITDPCTSYIDKRSHKKIKVRITIEEI